MNSCASSRSLALGRACSDDALLVVVVAGARRCVDVDAAVGTKAVAFLEESCKAATKQTAKDSLIML